MAIQRLLTGRSAQFVDNSGIQGQYAQQVELVYSEVTSSTYATSTMRYAPILKVTTPNEEYFQVQFRATRSGTVMLTASYAMSVDDAGDVVFDFSQLAAAVGESPNGALAAGSSLTFTPGSGQNCKSVSIDSAFDVVEGDNVVFRVTRADDAADDHPGSFNLLNLLVTVQ